MAHAFSKWFRITLLICFLVLATGLFAAPPKPGTPTWNLTTDVITFTVNATSVDPVTSFSAVLYDDTNFVVNTYTVASLNLTDNTVYNHDFHAAMLSRGTNKKYYVIVTSTNNDGSIASDPSANNVKGLATLSISGLLDFGSSPNLILFNSSGNHTAFSYNTGTKAYNHALRNEVEAIDILFPAEGQYQLSGIYHGSPNTTIFTQAMVTGSQIVYLNEAQSSAGRDANGQPNDDTQNNVLTITVNPGNTDFETIYTLRFRRRLYTPVLSITGITHSAWAFSCTINGDDSGSPQPSAVNGDTIASVQSVVWSVNPISGTGYFNGNQFIALSSGDITVTAKNQNGHMVSATSGTYSITGSGSYSPHLAMLELRNGKTGEGPMTLSSEFSSDPSKSGIYSTSIAGEFSAIRITTWAPKDCQLYLNGVRIANNCHSVIRLEPTTPNGNPSENIYTLRVEKGQEHKDYSIRVQREVASRLVYGRQTGSTPHLAATSNGDIFSMNNAAVKDKFTIHAWVRWTSDPAGTNPVPDPWANIATLTDSQDSGNFWLQHNQLNSKFEFAFSTTAGRSFAQSVTVPQQGVWYLLTGVYDGAFVNIYVNGNWEARVSRTGDFRFVAGSSEFNIGKIPKQLRRFPGNIRDVRIWVGTARTAAQIAQDYAGTSTNDANFSWPLNETSVGSVTTGRGSVNLNMVNVLPTDFISCCQNNMPQGQAFIFRPSRIDATSSSSESVILVHANNYNSANSRFSVLGPETSQATRMQVWDHVAKVWSAPDAIANGVQMDSFFGNPSGSTRFWIPIRMNTSTAGTGRYIDDGGAYDGNDFDVAGRTKYNAILPLPPITVMSSPFSLSGKLIGTSTYPLTAKYVILGYDEVAKGTLITATSSDIGAKGAGDYVLRSDVAIKRIEVRTQDDILITSLTNPAGWSGTTPLSDTTLPVELTSFTALAFGDTAQLNWSSASESNLLGYYVYRSTTNDYGTAQQISPLIEATNSSQTQSYNFDDSDVVYDTMYFYWLLAVEYSGQHSLHGPVSLKIENPDSNPEIPIFTGLSNIYPNPFNPTVNIRYGLKSDGDVSLKVYNMKGQKVKTWMYPNQKKGYYNLIWDSHGESSGVYLLVFESGKAREIRKLTITK